MDNLQNLTPDQIFDELSKRFTGTDKLNNKDIDRENWRTVISFLVILVSQNIRDYEAICIYHNKPDIIEFKSKTYNYPEELDNLADDIKFSVKNKIKR